MHVETNTFIQPACLGGIKNEFLYSARLDNQATCFVSIENSIAHTNSDNFENDQDISMARLFDHEEVGSQSSQEAGSPVVSKAVRKKSGALDQDIYSASCRKSLFFSVDKVHALEC